MVQTFVLLSAILYVVMNLVHRHPLRRRRPARPRAGDEVSPRATSCSRYGTSETNFHTNEGVVRAVRDVSLEVERGHRVGVVGESGSGKSALALSVLGLIEPPGKVERRPGRASTAARSRSFSDRQMQRVRGKEISLIFQDPMTALDPVKTIGDQVIEAIQRHRRARRQGRARRGDRPAARRRGAARRTPHGRLPAPVLGRHAAAGADRDRAREPARPADRRRADDRPRRHDAGAGARRARAARDRAEHGRHADHPQSRRRRRVLRQRRSSCTRAASSSARRCDELFARQTHPYTEALLRSVPRPDRLQRGPLPTIPGFPPSLANLPPGCPFEPRCPVGHGLEVCRSEAPPPVNVGSGASARRRRVPFRGGALARGAPRSLPARRSVEA